MPVVVPVPVVAPPPLQAVLLPYKIPPGGLDTIEENPTLGAQSIFSAIPWWAWLGAAAGGLYWMKGKR